jgi:hypothetical protein
MRSIESRIKKLEEKLNIGRIVRPRVIVIQLESEEMRRQLPENVRDWLTYQKEIRKYPNTQLVMLHDSEELLERGLPAVNLPRWHQKYRQQNSTKNNNKKENE